MLFFLSFFERDCLLCAVRANCPSQDTSELFARLIFGDISEVGKWHSRINWRRHPADIQCGSLSDVHLPQLCVFGSLTSLHVISVAMEHAYF